MKARSSGTGASAPVGLLVIATVLGLSHPAWSDAQPSPYAGQHRRSLKALSQDEVRGYLTGEGMGFSKAAELNNYPGPLHVIEMADILDLYPTQIEATRELLESVKREVTELGKTMVEKERELDTLFASGGAGPATSDALVMQIAALRGRIRAAHLRAHIVQKSILTPEQTQRYDKVRGYDGGGSSRKHGHAH